MSEIPTLPPSETPVVETGAPGVLVGVAPKENEVFLGGVIIVVLCTLLLLLTGTFGYFGYRLWQASQTERATPSIQELGEKMASSTMSTPPTLGESTPSPTPAPAVTPTPETPLPDKASVEVKVLNGGGARGSASTLAELLKKAGYAKVSFGNTTGDYTGTAVYHDASVTKTAELLKEEVMKTYPKVTLAPAKAGDKDTTAASIVVILGKD